MLTVGQSIVPTSLECAWQWDYAFEVKELCALYSKARESQWNPERDVDWDLEVPRDGSFLEAASSSTYCLLWMLGAGREERTSAQREELAWNLSQILHGEQATLLLCAQLINECPLSEQKLCLSAQAFDEARHCEVFGKLLTRKFDGIRPIGPHLKALFDDLLATPDWRKKCLGAQLLIEGIALGTFSQLRSSVSNELIQSILVRVIQDESRHAAFGQITVGSILSTVSEEERADFERFALNVMERLSSSEVLFEMQATLSVSRLSTQHVEVLLSRNNGDSPLRRLLRRRKEIYRRVVRTLNQFGLITDLTRPRYCELELLDAGIVTAAMKV